MEAQQIYNSPKNFGKKKEQNWRTVSDFKTYYKASVSEII